MTRTDAERQDGNALGRLHTCCAFLLAPAAAPTSILTEPPDEEDSIQAPEGK
jgi:hypothetical protein